MNVLIWQKTFFQQDSSNIQNIKEQYISGLKWHATLGNPRVSLTALSVINSIDTWS